MAQKSEHILRTSRVFPRKIAVRWLFLNAVFNHFLLEDFSHERESIKAAVSRSSVSFWQPFCAGKIMAAVRQGRGKRQLIEKKRHLLDSTWPVKLFVRLIELSWSDVHGTCASSHHFCSRKKAQKITEYRDTAPLIGRVRSIVISKLMVFSAPAGVPAKMRTRENMHLTILRQRILIRRQNSPVKCSRENVHQPRICAPNSWHFAHALHFAHAQNRHLTTCTTQQSTVAGL